MLRSEIVAPKEAEDEQASIATENVEDDVSITDDPLTELEPPAYDLEQTEPTPSIPASEHEDEQVEEDAAQEEEKDIEQENQIAEFYKKVTAAKTNSEKAQLLTANFNEFKSTLLTNSDALFDFLTGMDDELFVALIKQLANNFYNIPLLTVTALQTVHIDDYMDSFIKANNELIGKCLLDYIKLASRISELVASAKLETWVANYNNQAITADGLLKSCVQSLRTLITLADIKQTDEHGNNFLHLIALLKPKDYENLIGEYDFTHGIAASSLLACMQENSKHETPFDIAFKRSNLKFIHHFVHLKLLPAANNLSMIKYILEPSEADLNKKNSLIILLPAILNGVSVSDVNLNILYDLIYTCGAHQNLHESFKISATKALFECIINRIDWKPKTCEPIKVAITGEYSFKYALLGIIKEAFTQDNVKTKRNLLIYLLRDAKLLPDTQDLNLYVGEAQAKSFAQTIFDTAKECTSNFKDLGIDNNYAALLFLIKIRREAGYMLYDNEIELALKSALANLTQGKLFEVRQLLDYLKTFSLLSFEARLLRNLYQYLQPYATNQEYMDALGINPTVFSSSMLYSYTDLTQTLNTQGLLGSASTMLASTFKLKT